MDNAANLFMTVPLSKRFTCSNEVQHKPFTKEYQCRISFKFNAICKLFIPYCLQNWCPAKTLHIIERMMPFHNECIQDNFNPDNAYYLSNGKD